MTLQCEEVEFCKLNIHYVAEATKVTSKRKEAVAQFRKIQIPGYRAGRAPDYAIETKLKKQIEEWMKRELIAEAYDDILFETKIKPIGYPQVNKIELRDNDFWCDLTVLKKPAVELKQYKGFELPKPHQEYTVDEMVERMLQELREQHGEVSPYSASDFVQLGDKITLDVKIVEGETARTDLDKDGDLYHVGDKMFADFDDNIFGMSAGEERTFPIDLGGKTGQATVKVHMGMRNIPAALDDTLAQKVGFESCDKLREVAKGIATGKLKEHENQELSQQIVRKLVELHEFEMPSWLISMEAQQLAAQSKLKWTDLEDEHKEMFLGRARNNVKLALIMDEIKEREPEAFFSDMELLNVVRQRVAGMGQDPEKFLVEAERDGRLLGLLAALRNEATLQWLVTQSKVIE
jgi:trigger factor